VFIPKLEQVVSLENKEGSFSFKTPFTQFLLLLSKVFSCKIQHVGRVEEEVIGEEEAIVVVGVEEEIVGEEDEDEEDKEDEARDEDEGEDDDDDDEEDEEEELMENRLFAFFQSR